jgi:hypothetical protein
MIPEKEIAAGTFISGGDFAYQAKFVRAPRTH